ncbi:sulfur carrier protein ThiS [Amycolatopsis sp. Hca4]|uniref:sulfur carrier protein ThiS n=1 Tax=unclassified Amycolatopsis TaxID=2618356 RepID=UPI0015900AAE|nr:sulfur carrier protein ThiS [Amycolatopsis sp. Hca4]QKV77796.1 sulfur carrier protein ThiS [Amycolatopsis sp. Hca4]
MEIKLNGEWTEFPDGATVADVLDRTGGARPGIAVAVDGVVVRRADWAATAVPKGAVLDVLTAVQGG